MLTTLIFVSLALAAGLLIGYLFAHSRGVQALSEVRSERDVMRSQLESATAGLQEIRTLHSQQIAELRQQHRSDMELQIQLLREQLKSSTESLLRERSEQLTTANNESLSKILNPLQQNIELMQKAVENSQREHTEGMTRLDECIKTTLQQANLVGERADRLVTALMSENKVQGNFGELLLHQLLENMGLEPGVQFTEQAALRDEEGQPLRGEDGSRTMIPDVVLHFPDERDVVIDSKMSFTAFIDYSNAHSDEEREEALSRHLQSVRSHVEELARKNYSAYINKDRVRLDYVIMYMPYEGAYQLAVTADPALYQWAYNKGVVISSTQNMYALLRMIEICWRQQHHLENQDNIIQAANVIMERVQRFYERFLDTKAELRKTEEAFEGLEKMLQPSGQSIYNAAGTLLNYGAKRSKNKTSRKPDFPVCDSDVALIENKEE